MLVSIFMPVYNGERYLAQTIDSVLAQSYAGFELLCVDDSSTDSSYDILRRYARLDARVKIFRKPNGGDVPHSWQYVMPRIGGDFTLYMSQDDLLDPRCLELLVARQQQTGADAVVVKEFLYFADRPLDELPRIGSDSLLPKVIPGREAFSLMLDYQIPGFVLWRTAIIRRIGMPTDTFNADELAQRQWAAACAAVAFSEGVFYYRCDNPAGITKHLHPRVYGDVLTDARLFAEARSLLPDQPALVQQLHDHNYQLLFFRAMLYLQHRREYAAADRAAIRRHIAAAYRIEHRGVCLTDRKHRVSTRALPLFWAVACVRLLQYRRRGVVLRIDSYDPPPLIR